MSRAGTLKSIDCPSCGAGLQILGGGRVTTHVCPYCGTMLDALENYRALAKFAAVERPASPFRIGMSGTLRCVKWQIIGTLGMREDYGGRSWKWTEHLLFSATHGYSWLSVEDGHLIWTRRYRGPLSPGWISPAQVERADHPPRANARGEHFRYYETYTSTIAFAEGEFTWRPKQGDHSTAVSLMSDRHMLDYVATPREREIERSEYLPRAETLAAFGAEDPGPPTARHPLEPYVPGPNDRFLARTGGAFAVICLVLGLYIGMTGHRILGPESIATKTMPVDLPLNVDSPGRLVQLKISGDRSQNWSWIGIDLSDPQGQPVFSAGREISFYSGYDDGSWTEDNRTATLAFRAGAAGTYTLSLSVDGSGTGDKASRRTPPPAALAVSAVDGTGSGLWLYILAVVFALIAGRYAAKAPIHRGRRWAGSDWSDDD